MSAALLSMLKGESWTREFAVTRNGVALGADGWEIELTLYDADDSSSVLFRSSTSGHTEWLENGVLSVTVPRNVISSWDVEAAIFLLTIRDPSDVEEDELGRSWVVLRGYLEVLAPDVPERVFRGAGRERIFRGSDGVVVKVHGQGEAVAPPPPAPAPSPAPAPGAVVPLTFTTGVTTSLTGVIPTGRVFAGVAEGEATLSVANAEGTVGSEFTVVLTTPGDSELLFYVDDAMDNVHSFLVPEGVTRMVLRFMNMGAGAVYLISRVLAGATYE